MRARNIKPDFFRDAELAEVTVETRYLFIGLWCLADREGKLKDHPKQIRFEVFPETKTKDDIETMLKSLVEHGLIIRYVVENKRFIKVTNFLKHQSPHTTEKRSEIPEPNVSSREATLSNVDIALIPDCGILNPDLLNPEERIAPPAPGNGDARALSPAFSCECFEISSEYLAELAVKFPLLPGEYLTKEFFPKMRDWCLDNRKTSKHLKKFDARGRLKNPRRSFSAWLKNEDPGRAAGYIEAPVKFYVPPEDSGKGMTFDRNCPLCKGHPGSMLTPPGSDHKYDPCTCLHPINEVKNGAPQTTAPAK
jgi:hypothetical protein